VQYLALFLNESKHYSLKVRKLQNQYSWSATKLTLSIVAFQDRSYIFKKKGCSVPVKVVLC